MGLHVVVPRDIAELKPPDHFIKLHSSQCHVSENLSLFVCYWIRQILQQLGYARPNPEIRDEQSTGLSTRTQEEVHGGSAGFSSDQCAQALWNGLHVSFVLQVRSKRKDMASCRA